MTEYKEKSGYIAVGSVRGWCGHVHKTQDAAEACAERDSKDCRAARGYSDRGVRSTDDESVSFSTYRGYYMPGGN